MPLILPSPNRTDMRRRRNFTAPLLRMKDERGIDRVALDASEEDDDGVQEVTMDGRQLSEQVPSQI